MADQLPQPMIVMTPPAQPGVSSSTHPRRKPAHRSVSLLHSPKKTPPTPVKDASDSSSDDAAIESQATVGSSDSPSSLLPLGRNSSGESSNADKWFEKSNNDVRDTGASFADNEPPFFMRNSSSSQTPPEAQQQMRQFLGINDGSNALPLRTGLNHLNTDGSSTEDYRGVIDDLTIENKKLKRKLKKYEKLHDSHLKDEKLFEVRIHGLPADKKRELEDTLRKFAASLGNGAFPANGYDGLRPLLEAQKTASSQTSMQNPDSAYASMSMSGQGSNAHSGNESRHKPTPKSATRKNMRSNIQSYLHQVPDRLLVQPNPANMTERARKKLVVKRLEQVFAGKGATLGGHQHPMQQQEVSHSAAQADRAESEAQGEKTGLEGVRESHMMSRGDVVPATKQDNKSGSTEDEFSEEHEGKQYSLLSRRNLAKQDEQDLNEQRPTRPLDLDPYRAQVPAENIRYMRHLGFSPRDPSDLPDDGHGWVYLNLLMNMAQLHTVNVTVDFVHKALTECSSKFEVSADGRKVRWKGGQSITHSGSSAGGSSLSRTDTPEGRSPRKRPKLTHRESAKSAGSLKQPEANKLSYTPLFFHRDSTDEADSSEEYDEGDDSPFPAPAGDSTGMTSSGVRTMSSKKHKTREDGPIIFYNNARFCTDLSGERRIIGNMNAPPYTPATAVPLGVSRQPGAVSQVGSEKRGPLAEAAELPEPMNLGDNPIPDDLELSFPGHSPRRNDPEASVNKDVQMEVTGIGGVWPADHFAIAVESRQALLNDDSAPPGGVSKQRLPSKLAGIFQEYAPKKRKSQIAVQQQIVRTKRQMLPPAELPPALSFMPFGEDSLGDDDESDVEEEFSLSPDSIDGFPPAASPQPIKLTYAASEEEEYSEDESDDGSLDLLAAARELDPAAIQAQEREYDANMAERLAEEIPAGSSAATAGGGSGFASPANDVDRKEYRRAVREALAKRPNQNLERTKTADSMKVEAPRDESSGEEEDDDDDMDDAAS